mgnify:CR=1 FL=1
MGRGAGRRSGGGPGRLTEEQRSSLLAVYRSYVETGHDPMYPKVAAEVWGDDVDTWMASPYAPQGVAKPVDGGYIDRKSVV